MVYYQKTDLVLKLNFDHTNHLTNHYTNQVLKLKLNSN